MGDVVVNCDSEGGELGVRWIEIDCGGEVADAVTRMEHRVREDEGGVYFGGSSNCSCIRSNIDSKFMILAKFRYLQLRGNITCNRHLGDDFLVIGCSTFLGLTDRLFPI